MGTIRKVNINEVLPEGNGLKQLIGNELLSLRYWSKEPPKWPSDPSQHKGYRTRDYDVLGYVIEGKAELQTDHDILVLEKGDSWSVPGGVRHRYVIKEPLTVIEATSSPAS